MKLDSIGNILFFLFIIIIGTGAIIGAINSAKECQVYPASECPDCICKVEDCICEEVNCIDEIIKEQIKADHTKRILGEILE